VKPQHIVATCLRFLALIWLLYALSHANSVFAYARADSRVSVNSLAVWLVTLAQLAGCAVLWFFPLTISAKLVPGGAEASTPDVPPRLAEWQTLGVICIGLWGLVHSIPSLVFQLTLAALTLDDEFHGGLPPDDKARIASAAVQLALSLWLVFGAKGFAEMLFRIRTAGVAKSQASPE